MNKKIPQAAKPLRDLQNHFQERFPMKNEVTSLDAHGKLKLVKSEKEGGEGSELSDLHRLKNGFNQEKDCRIYVESGRAFICNAGLTSVVFDSEQFIHPAILNSQLEPIKQASKSPNIDRMIEHLGGGVDCDGERIITILKCLSNFDATKDGVKLAIDFSYNVGFGIPNLMCNCEVENGFIVNPWVLKRAIKTIPLRDRDRIEFQYDKSQNILLGVMGETRLFIVEVDEQI